MSKYKYKTRGKLESRKQKSPRQPVDNEYDSPRYDQEPREEPGAEPFNLENMTGMTYPGSWLESIAERRSFLDTDTDEDYGDYLDENEYYE